MDTDAIIARRPQVALVDELAHTNVPGSPHAKRWQDIEDLLAAGITVLSTLNIQHLESLNDVVQTITGVPQRETVPDEIVRRAEQVELVDMTPEALRRRMVHGNVYKPEKVDAALGNYFRVGNLTALRELALLWLADKVDDQLDRYRAEHDIDKTWEARERVVVALTGGPEGETLIRRAARIADRARGADLMAVHITRSDGLAGADPALLAQQRVLLESLGGTYHEVVGADIPKALLDFARSVNATQLVLGASRRGRFAQILSRGVGVTTTAESGSIDVHLVTHDEAKKGRRLSGGTASALSPQRRLAGFALARRRAAAADPVAGHASASSTWPATSCCSCSPWWSSRWSAGCGRRWSPRSAGSCCSTTSSPRRSGDGRSPSRKTCWRWWCSWASGISVAAVVDLAARRTREAAAGAGRGARSWPPSPGACCAANDRCRRCCNSCAKPSSSTSVTLLQKRTRRRHDGGDAPRPHVLVCRRIRGRARRRYTGRRRRRRARR